MAEEKQSESKASAPRSTSPKATRRTRSRYNTPPVQAKSEIELVEESFAILTEQGDKLTARFFERLVQQHPDLQPLFTGVSMDGQQKKFFASLVLIVQSLRQPEMLEDYLRGLGSRHLNYGVKPDFYTPFVDNLLVVMAELSGEQWTAETGLAWTNTIERITQMMKAGINDDETEHQEPEQQSEQKLASTKPPQEQQQNSATPYKLAIDVIRTPVVIVDKTLEISYANQAAIEVLTHYQDVLRQRYPQLSISELVGTNIGLFHPQPEQLNAFLSSVENLPQNQDIELGPLSFNVNITAILDDDGVYAGNIMEWVNNTDYNDLDASYEAQLAVITETSRDITESGQQLTLASSDLNSQIQRQTVSWQQIMSAAHALSNVANETASNAEHISQSLSQVEQQSIKGSELNKQTTDALFAFTHVNQKITQLMTVVEDMAFQTNILALNAAVESAREGRQNSNFALAATEVRSLAHQSAAAVKELKILLNDSNERIKTGAETVDDANQLLAKMAAESTQLRQQISDRATAKNGQHLAFEQMTNLAGQIDEILQQNSALSQQMMAMSEQLAIQAKQLETATASFDIS